MFARLLVCVVFLLFGNGFAWAAASYVVPLDEHIRSVSAATQLATGQAWEWCNKGIKVMAPVRDNHDVIISYRRVSKTRRILHNLPMGTLISVPAALVATKIIEIPADSTLSSVCAHFTDWACKERIVLLNSDISSARLPQRLMVPWWFIPQLPFTADIPQPSLAPKAAVKLQAIMGKAYYRHIPLRNWLLLTVLTILSLLVMFLFSRGRKWERAYRYEHEQVIELSKIPSTDPAEVFANVTNIVMDTAETLKLYLNDNHPALYGKLVIVERLTSIHFFCKNKESFTERDIDILTEALLSFRTRRDPNYEMEVRPGSPLEIGLPVYLQAKYNPTEASTGRSKTHKVA